MSAPEAARFFLALSDPTRLALLAVLRDGEQPVNDLVDRLGCPQPKVSRHLKVLKDARLVGARRDGRNIFYALTTPRNWPPEARDWIRRLDAGLLPREMTAEGHPAPARERPRAAVPAPASGEERAAPATAPASAPEMEDFLL